MALIFQRMVKQAFDLQHLGGAEEGVESLPLHLDLALAHEVQEEPEVDLAHVSQYHYRVLTGVTLKNIVVVREEKNAVLILASLGLYYYCGT